MNVFLLLAGVLALAEGVLHGLGRRRPGPFPRAVGLGSVVVGAFLLASGVSDPGRFGFPDWFATGVALAVYVVAGGQVVRSMQRVRRQADSESHRLFLYVKSREISESEERAGRGGTASDGSTFLPR